ncbi:MAG: dockerin type I repeat-containing protein [Oscillospiraceae bacterium]|jgi:hypothetical protein|nr:dockerin type I repeat-containing protein [Oscillospiraceae bacterium]
MKFTKIGKNGLCRMVAVVLAVCLLCGLMYGCVTEDTTTPPGIAENSDGTVTITGDFLFDDAGNSGTLKDYGVFISTDENAIKNLNTSGDDTTLSADANMSNITKVAGTDTTVYGNYTYGNTLEISVTTPVLERETTYYYRFYMTGDLLEMTQQTNQTAVFANYYSFTTSAITFDSYNYVVLDVAKGRIDIYPTYYTQGGATVQATASRTFYIITGSAEKVDNQFRFFNTSTELTVKYNAMFSNLSLRAVGNASAMMIMSKTGSIDLDLYLEGTNTINSGIYYHPAIASEPDGYSTSVNLIPLYGSNSTFNNYYDRFNTPIALSQYANFTCAATALEKILVNGSESELTAAQSASPLVITGKPLTRSQTITYGDSLPVYAEYFNSGLVLNISSQQLKCLELYKNKAVPETNEYYDYAAYPEISTILPAGKYSFKTDITRDLERYMPMQTVTADLTIEPVPLWGDVDMDGSVSIADATEIQKYLAMFIDLDEFQLQAADADLDGGVNIVDVTILQKVLAKIMPQPE